MLTCPICHTVLTAVQKSYRCQNGHSYDIAKEGYVNLHLVQHKNSKQAGDTPKSVQARRRFLAGGHYADLQVKLGQIVADLAVDNVLDIGCGEGYYTAHLAKYTKTVYALDIAKTAVQTASKTHKNQANITWIVGTGTILPIADGSVDICTSFFSPLPKAQMHKALKQGGYLLMATPAPQHLFAMRERLFDEVKPHEPAKFIETLAPEFELIQEWRVSSDLILDSQSLSDLIDMTPYTYKAKLENKTALKQEKTFAVTAEFCVYLFGRG